MSLGESVLPSVGNAEKQISGGSIRMEVSNPEASAKKGELVLCNINMDSSGGDF